MTHRRPQKERGTIAVELAISLVFLMLLTMAVGDFGRIFYWGITLNGAARAGVAYGAQNNAKAGDAEGIEQAALNDAENIGEISVSSDRICKCTDGTTVSCTTTCANSNPHEVYVQVTASTTFNTLVDYPGIPSTIPLSRTAIFRIQ